MLQRKCGIRTNKYHFSNSARIDENIQHARFVDELAAEKTKIKNKYVSRLVDVKKFADVP
jgi:hypothetical protein